MKKKLQQLCTIALLSLLVIGLMVSTVIAQDYFSSINLNETASVSYNMFPARTPLNTTFLISENYITASGLDTRVMTNGHTAPHMLSDDKLLFAYALPALSSNPLFFYTGMTALASFDIITGYNGYVTVADNAAMEPGDNFEIEHSGYIDTSASMVGQNILHKLGAYKTYISSTGNVHSGIINPLIGSGAWTSPTGFVDGGAEWTNEANTYDGNTLTFATRAALGIGAWSNYLELTVSSTATSNVRYYIDLAGGNSLDLDVYYNSVWNHVFQGVYTVGVWTELNLGAAYNVTAARVRVQNNTAAPLDMHFNELEFGTPSYSVAVDAAVTSGEHIIETTADSINLRLYVDTVLQDTAALAGASVPDNANNWVYGQYNTIPHIDYHFLTVNGVLIAHYQPVSYIIGTALPDRQGIAQDGVITWGSNPTGISIAIGSLLEFGAAIEEVQQLVTPDIAGDISEPTGMYLTDTEMEGTNQLFYFFVSDIAELSDTPMQFIWWSLAAALIVLTITVAAKYFSSTWNIGLAVIIVTGVIIGMSLLPSWVMVITILIVLGLAVMERSPSL